MGKPHWVKTCSDLANHFVDIVTRKYIERAAFNEVHFIFDRYDEASISLKSDTRRKRQGGRTGIQYKISESTNISNVSLAKLLSHCATKDELSEYLSKKVLNWAAEADGDINIVCSWRDKAESNKTDVSHLSSSHEEADTKIVLHAVDATERGATQVSIYSLDTDVFILFVRRFPKLPKHTLFCTGTGINRREVNVANIYQSMTPLQARALPGLHAVSGADITGSFAGKGKKTFWKAFMSSSNEVLRALSELGEGPISNNMHVLSILEAFICRVYIPDTVETNVGAVRWAIFRTQQKESEKLPPTKDALIQALMRANYQAIIWNNDIVANPNLPCPKDFGWKEDRGHLIPVMTDQPPAPEAVLQLIRCNCTKSFCATLKCKCKSNNLPCTDLCSCGSDEGECLNTLVKHLLNDGDETLFEC
jgi:hypothetical protein